MCFWNTPQQVRTIDDTIWNSYVDFYLSHRGCTSVVLDSTRVRTYACSGGALCSLMYVQFEIDTQG